MPAEMMVAKGADQVQHYTAVTVFSEEELHGGKKS